MQLTYTQLLNQTIDIYLTGDYEKAYAFITKHGDEVIGNLAQIYNFRYAIASKMSQKSLALKLMTEAIMDHGFWYAIDYLKSDDDLNSLREEKQFQLLLKICEKRENEALKSCEGKYELLTSKAVKEDRKQLIIALHGNQESNQISKFYWKNVIDKKRIIALFQSSEIEFSDAYIWNDLDQGIKVINTLKSQMNNELYIDKSKEILTGFSAGARQVLYYTLVTSARVKGLILIAPWLPELEEWKEKLQVLKEKHVKVVIICGKNDEDAYDDSNKLGELLNTHQIDHQLRIMEDLAHDYPINFSEVIEEAIQFINS